MMFRLYAAALAAMMSGLLCQPAAAQPSISGAAVVTGAVSGRPLPDTQLRAMYSDHTWRWDDGAGYFDPSGRFTAFVGDAAKARYAEGTWTAVGGQLCFEATWHALSGDTAERKCFAHVGDGRIVYQRKLPDGKWYLFAHVPARAGDEAMKLEAGDQVRPSYRANKRYVSSHAPDRIR